MNKIKLKFEFKEYAQIFIANRLRIMTFIAAQLQTNRAMLFEASGNYNGHEPWDPLKWRRGQPLVSSGARGLRGSMAPRNNGLSPGKGANSIVEIGNNSVTIGTSLIYASIHDQGGVINAKPGGALKIPVNANQIQGASLDSKLSKAKDQYEKEQVIRDHAAAKLTPKKFYKKMGAVQIDGKWFIFRKSVRIPRRNFTDFTKQDENEIQVAVSNLLEKIWNNG